MIIANFKHGEHDIYNTRFRAFLTGIAKSSRKPAQPRYSYAAMPALGSIFVAETKQRRANDNIL